MAKKELSGYALQLLGLQQGTPSGDPASNAPVPKSASQQLELKLIGRPKKTELHKANILNKEHAKIAPKYAALAKKMEINFNKSQLHRRLSNRATRDSLIQRGVIYHPNENGHTLLAPMKSLENAFKRDSLKQALERRPDKSILVKKNILDADHSREKIDFSLVPKSIALDKAFRADNLAASLRERPSIHLLHDQNVLNKHVVMYGESKTNKEKLEEHLQNRRAPSEMPGSILKTKGHSTHVDSSLHKASNSLEKSLNRDSLHRAFKNRPSFQEVKKMGYTDDGHGQIADRLIQPSNQLAKSFKSDLLSKHLRERPEAEEVSHLHKVPDFLKDEYVSPLPPRDASKPMGLNHALDEVRHCLHNITRFKMWLDNMEDA